MTTRLAEPVPATAEYETGACRPGDLAEVAALLRSVFGVSHGPRHLHWKYFAAPLALPLCTVLRHRGRLVGFHGHQTQLWRRGDAEPVRVAFGMDIAALPEHRRIDTLLRMAGDSARRFAEHGVAWICGIPLPDMAELNTGLFGFTDTGSLPRQQRVLRVGRALARRGHPRLARLLGPATACLRPGAPTVPANLEIFRPTSFREMGSAWTTPASDCWQRVRDPDWLDWRHLHPVAPAQDVWALRARGEASWMGWAAWSRRDDADGLRRAFLLDFGLRPGLGPREAALLPRQVLREAHDAGCDSLEVRLSDEHPSAPVFRRLGFRPRPRARKTWHVLPLDPSLPLANLPRHWTLALADSDEP